MIGNFRSTYRRRGQPVCAPGHRSLAPSPPRQVQLRGVTLIEVLIVVSIMGLAASIVVPTLIQPGQLTIQAASRLVVSDLLTAQNEAVGQASARRLVFDVAGNGYRLTDGAGATVALPWMKQGYSVSFANDRRFSGIALVSADFGGNSWVQFDELGGTTTGGTIEIAAQGYRYIISVRPFTGRVTVAPAP
jgi:prepilin-type N-terminal cleavage/methylation domain-containing protein